MKCPLLMINHSRFGREPEYSESDCICEECAWWDKLGNQCIIQSLVMENNLLRTVRRAPLPPGL